ncbi:hypothetical protein QUQ99_000969 [Escherichia coli]|nr:hypothetical protein [Escherichia coli]
MRIKYIFILFFFLSIHHSIANEALYWLMGSGADVMNVKGFTYLENTTSSYPEEPAGIERVWQCQYGNRCYITINDAELVYAKVLEPVQITGLDPRLNFAIDDKDLTHTSPAKPNRFTWLSPAKISTALGERVSMSASSGKYYGMPTPILSFGTGASVSISSDDINYKLPDNVSGDIVIRVAVRGRATIQTNNNKTDNTFYSWGDVKIRYAAQRLANPISINVTPTTVQCVGLQGGLAKCDPATLHIDNPDSSLVNVYAELNSNCDGYDFILNDNNISNTGEWEKSWTDKKVSEPIHVVVDDKYSKGGTCNGAINFYVRFN